MKLGLAVVYLVAEDSEPLIRIHLERIRRHTRVPYVIHATPLRLPARFRRHLDAPDIRCHEITPPADVLAHEEHSHLLTALLHAAAGEGCTHVGTLHVDSFPVVDDWAEALAAELTPEAPVTAIQEEMEGDTAARPNLAGMMMLTKYWRESRPFLTPSGGLESTAEWKEFMRRHQQPVLHSGVGLGFCLEREGRRWTPIRRTNGRSRHPVLAGIYGGRIFHLGAASRPRTFFTETVRSEEGGWMRGRRWVAGLVRRLLPKPIRRMLRPLRPIGRFYDERPLQWNERVFSQIRSELFTDPEGFLRDPSPQSTQTNPPQ